LGGGPGGGMKKEEFFIQLKMSICFCHVH
jgi:hypothetical protein